MCNRTEPDYHTCRREDGFADTSLAMSKAFTLCCTLDEAKAVREEVAFFQAVRVLLTKREISTKKRTNEERELAIRQIIGSALVSDEVVDIFQAVGLRTWHENLAFTFRLCPTMSCCGATGGRTFSSVNVVKINDTDELVKKKMCAYILNFQS